jgi:glyoxylase-like metal-dependent hydrolase (beta-lactamase superfamily II)
LHVRSISVHDDVLVVVSQVWQTTATAVRAGSGGVLIDSPILPQELTTLPGVLEEAGFIVSGLLATHGDWDHLLGRLAFPEAELRAGESTVARLMAEPDRPHRDLRGFDDEYYLAERAPLTLGEVRPLPPAGGTFELIDASGHTADGTALWLSWARVLICGDYLSPVEIPVLSGDGSLDGYLETLERFAPLLEQAETVIPGHGAPLTSARAAEIRDADVAYLERLSAGGDAPLPADRDTAEQRLIHQRNLAGLRQPV